MQASRHTTLQSTTLGLHRVIYVPNYMDHYNYLPTHEGWMAELAMTYNVGRRVVMAQSICSRIGVERRPNHNHIEFDSYVDCCMTTA